LTRTDGPELTLSESTAVNPTFKPPSTIFQETLVFELMETNKGSLISEPDSVAVTVLYGFEGIIGSGNNINIQVQQNSGNNVGGGKSGFGERTNSDSPILRGQATEQKSQVVS